MTEAMLRALIAALEADLATPEPKATEAGRIFSSKNEVQLRAAVQALNALLAQVSAPPDPTQIPVVPPAAPAVPVQQSVGAPSGHMAIEASLAAHMEAAPPAGHGVSAADMAGMTTAQMQTRHDSMHAGGKAGHPVPVMMTASISTATDTIAQEAAVAITEAAIKDGKSLIRIITPGWGSSGHYSPAVLERDAPLAFPRGTKMFWDHPGAADAARPERSLRDLAAELTEDAHWLPTGPDGAGVYSRVKVFGDYQRVVEELAPHIGVSIRSAALIRKGGTAEGRTGDIVERLVPSPTNSVDFVTIPGRGGRVTALFEAARGANHTTTEDDMGAEELKAAQEAQAKAERERDTALMAVAMHDARNVAAEAIAKVDMPNAAKARLLEAVIKDPPMKDGMLDKAAFTTSVEKAAAEEKAFVDRLLGKGEVKGMGSGTTSEAGNGSTAPDMTDAFQRMGLSESAAKIAAAGRH